MRIEIEEVEALCRQAASSGDGEAYLPLRSTALWRAGLVARAVSGARPVLILEVTLMSPHEQDPLRLIEAKRSNLGMLESLLRRGYAVTYEDGSSSTLEHEMSDSDLNEEVRTLSTILGQ